MRILVDGRGDLAGRPGLGSLAGSVVTADAGVRPRVVLGLAPWHGRLLVLDRDDAAESTGHGSPLPMLVHGGPGRAGGGEETGRHPRRRSPHAAHGHPGQPARCSSAVTGRWVPGGDRTAARSHPFRKSLADLRPGDAVVAGPRIGSSSRTSTTSPSSPATRSTRTRIRGGGRQPALRRHRRSWLPGAVARGRAVRAARPRTGARQLRPGEPALPHAGLPRRRADRHADRKQITRARSPRTTARSAGTPRSPSRTARSAARYDVLTLVARDLAGHRRPATGPAAHSSPAGRPAPGSQRERLRGNRGEQNIN